MSPPRRAMILAFLVLLCWAVPIRAQAPDLPAFAQPYPDDNPAPVELYPRVVPGHVVSPGDPHWPLGPARAAAAWFAVRRDGAERTPEGAESFRVDYDFPPTAVAAMSGELACLRSGARRDAAKTRGIRFAMRSSAPTTALISINASNADDPRRVDRFYGSFTVGTEWKVVTIHYRSLAVWPGWRERLAAQSGHQPGDGVLRPDRIEEIRIGLDPGRTPPGKGSLWVGDITFFR